MQINLIVVIILMVVEMIIGSHVNFGKEQLLGAVKQTISYDANTFMFYTGAPQNSIRKEINEDLTNEAFKLMKENGIDLKNVVCHAPYIINLANKDNVDSWDFSIDFLKKEIMRIEKLGVGFIVVHPGNYLKLDVNVALQNISDAINKILCEDTNVMFLLETMAGKGTECGRNMEEIKTILDKVLLKDKVGVCIDTCHLNDSGVDLNNFEEYLEKFDKMIGLDKLKCVHVNDSKNECGSHKDRHANLGYGTIGFEVLMNVVYHEKLKNVPKILETPWILEYPPYKLEIEMIKKRKFNSSLEEDLKKLFIETN